MEMTENTEKIPNAYLENMLLASISAFIGKPVQKVRATLPMSELTGDYLAGLVTGLHPEEHEFFAASLDAQVITCGMTSASVITKTRKWHRPHWITAMCAIKNVGDTVYVKMDVIACGC